MRSHISKALAEDDSDVFDDDARALLRADVPDHLPGSPLCPLDANHRDGGKGICPLHGSRKTMAMTSAVKMRKGRVGVAGQRGSLTGGVGKREPEIVFDSGDGSGRF